MDRRPLHEQRKAARLEDAVTAVVGLTLLAPIVGLVLYLILMSL